MRDCGECSACCRLPEISEINKPANTPCKHLCSKGYECKIYRGRPKMCADYKCCWLSGFGKNKDRPDKSGVLVESKETQFGLLMVAKSFKKGAIKTDAGQETINRIAASSICLVVQDDDMDRVYKIMGPEHLVKKFKAVYGIK